MTRHRARPEAARCTRDAPAPSPAARARCRRSAVPHRRWWSRCVRKTSRPVAATPTSAAAKNRSRSHRRGTSPAQARCSGWCSTRAGGSCTRHTLERVFKHHQRRAIALRDGGCVHPGLSRQRRLVRNPSRRGAFARWPDPYGQRRDALLAPPSHPLDERMDGQGEPWCSRSAGTLLVGLPAEVATRHEVPDPDARTHRESHVRPRVIEPREG